MFGGGENTSWENVGGEEGGWRGRDDKAEARDGCREAPSLKGDPQWGETNPTLGGLENTLTLLAVLDEKISLRAEAPTGRALISFDYSKAALASQGK